MNFKIVYKSIFQFFLIFGLVLSSVALYSQIPGRSGGKIGTIVSRGTLVVGLQKDYRPFHIEGGQKYPGFDVELAEKLGKALGVKVQYQFFSVNGLLQAVATGKVDVALGGISASLDRARFVNFSDPYLIATPAALVTRDVLPPESDSVDYPREKIEGLADLRKLGSLRLGVKEGTTNEKLLQDDEMLSRHRVTPFKDQKQLVEALQNGQVDGIVADDLFIKALLQATPTLIGRYLPLLKSYREDHISVAMAPGDIEFVYYINFFLSEMRRTMQLKQWISIYFESSDWIE